MALINVQPGGGPRTHALVIGVSRYPFATGSGPSDSGTSVELRDLTSAARSASEFAAWLLGEYRNPDAPLADVRILVSPSNGETLHPAVRSALHGPAPATRANVAAELGAFRASCRQDPSNVGIVYIAGHGVQLNKRGAIVLLQDFGDPTHLNELEGAIDVAGCRSAMDEGGSARVQLWFCDACRQLPDSARRFESMTGALTLSERNGQVESSPLFLASSSRENAFARVGGTSLFNQALLSALRSEAVIGPDASCEEWHVSVAQLIRLLPGRVRALLPERPGEQNVDVTGRVIDAVVQRFASPPTVDIVVRLRPEGVAPRPIATVQFGGSEPVDVPADWPLVFTGAAGLYLLEVAVEPPLVQGARKILNALPPACAEIVEVR
jgi:hypothetical protein